MGSVAKILFLKTSSTVSPKTLEINSVNNTENNMIQVENLGDKALKVLKEIEELWEMDHNSLELRDKFHLLRYYLKSSLT